MSLRLCSREEMRRRGQTERQSGEWAGEQRKETEWWGEASFHWCWVTYQRDHSCIPWVFGNNGGAWTHLPSSPNGRASAPVCVFSSSIAHRVCVTERETKGPVMKQIPSACGCGDMLRVLSGQCVCGCFWVCCQRREGVRTVANIAWTSCWGRKCCSEDYRASYFRILFLISSIFLMIAHPGVISGFNAPKNSPFCLFLTSVSTPSSHFFFLRANLIVSLMSHVPVALSFPPALILLMPDVLCLCQSGHYWAPALIGQVPVPLVTWFSVFTIGCVQMVELCSSWAIGESQVMRLLLQFCCSPDLTLMSLNWKLVGQFMTGRIV